MKNKLDLLKKALSAPGAVTKAANGPIFTNPNPALGYQQYNLDDVVVHYYDTYTPLLSAIPREGGQNGTGANWKLVQRLRGGQEFDGAPEGARGQVIQRDEIDTFQPFATLQKDLPVSDQSVAASQGLNPDSLASASVSLIQTFLSREHAVMVGGNRSSGLGTAVAPTAAAVEATGGSVAAATYAVFAVKLSVQGFLTAVDRGSVQLNATVTLADGTSQAYNGGFSAPSSATAVTVTSSENAIAVSTTADPLAGGYAWFVGADAASARLAALTSAASTTLLELDAAGQLLSALGAVDSSTNGLVFNGIITQIANGNSGSVVVNNGAQGLTSTGSGSIAEIDAMFKSAWNTHKVVYDKIYCSGNTAARISQIMLDSPAGSGAARVMVTRNADGSLEGGSIVTTYRAPIAGGNRAAEIVPLGDIPDGIILFYCSRIPYAQPDMRSPTAMLMAVDYRQETYARVRNRVELGMWTFGCLAVRYGGAWGMLYNLG